MSNFIKLVQNENMKLFRKTSTIIMIGMLLAFLIVAGFLTKYNGQEPTDNWKQDLQKQTQVMQAQLTHVTSSEADALKQKIAINDYELNHNIQPLTDKSIWGFANHPNDIMMFVIVFTIIIAGGMVSTEFGSGTIKLLLIRPIHRSKILLSKYVSIFIAAIIFSAIAIVFSWLIGGIFFGFDDLSHPYIFYTDGSIHLGSMFNHIIANYGFQFVSLIVMATIAFMISTVFRNTALAIGLTIFATMAGPLVTHFFAHYEWGKYILFSNLDLSVYFNDGATLADGLTLGFSVTVLLIYYLTFVIITWLLFNKRDVAA